MKLLGSTKNKVTKNENGENVPHLETAEVVLVHCNIVNNDYQQGSCIHLLYTFVYICIHICIHLYTFVVYILYQQGSCIHLLLINYLANF